VLTPGQRPTWWLSWAAAPYGWGIGLRAYAYERGWFAQRRLPVPVISVGNLTVGGTGKTPVVIDITQWLLGEGKRVAVLSRGYRRARGKSQLLVSDGVRVRAMPEEAGDEPFLIAQRCLNAVVAVGADRYRLGRRLLETCAVDCLVLDDGYQHLGLHRDVNLLLVDATDARGLEQLLPAGRLREPLAAAKRATAIIITRADQPSEVEEVIVRLRSAVEPLPQTAQVVFRPSEVVSVATGAGRSIEWCKGKTALLASGVGHGASFRRTAEALGVTIVGETVYPDHHRYDRSEVDTLRERAVKLKAELVLTTEKDAGKIRPYLLPTDGLWWAARLRVEWLTGEAAIRKTIMDAWPSTREGVHA
jgi:tetraacyldisaccharide 4'-kinase